MSSVFGICFQVFYFVVPFILLSFFFILLFHVTFFPSSLTIGFILAYCALSKLVGRRRNSIRPDWCGNIHWGSAFWLPSPLAARTPLFFQFSFSIVFCCVFCFFFLAGALKDSLRFSQIFGVFWEEIVQFYFAEALTGFSFGFWGGGNSEAVE